MADIKKVIEGFEHCIPDPKKPLKERMEENECRHEICPYGPYGNHGGEGLGCFWDLMSDALALLKEQNAKTHGADSGMCEICSFYERAMPVKPHYNARTNWYECGACHYSMTSGMHCCTVLIPAHKVGYCAKCGKAVKWE